MILLDTNVISEALRPAPNPEVIGWLNAHFTASAISSVTIFELGAGVALLDAGRRKDALESAVSRTVRRFGSRVYAFDAAAAHAASISATRPEATMSRRLVAAANCTGAELRPRRLARSRT